MIINPIFPSCEQWAYYQLMTNIFSDVSVNYDDQSDLKIELIINIIN